MLVFVSPEMVSGGLTFIIILLIVVSFFAGFFRGVRKSIFYVICYIIFWAIFLISLNPLAKFVFNMKSPVNVKDAILTYMATSDTIRNLLADESTASYQLFEGVVMSVIKLGLTIIFVILFLTVIKLIIFILWLTIGRRFLKLKKKVNNCDVEDENDEEDKNEENKKKYIYKKKHRLLGGVVGLIPGLMSCLLFLMPIQLVVDNVKVVFTAENLDNLDKLGVELNEDNIKLIEDLLEGYDSSLAGVYGKTKVNNKLVDFIMSSKVGNRKVALASDVNHLAIAGSKALALYSYIDKMTEESKKEDTTEVGLANETNEETVAPITDLEIIQALNNAEHTKMIKQMFDELSKVTLLDFLAPVGFEIERTTIEKNVSGAEENLMLKFEEDIKKVKWEKEMKTLGDIIILAIDFSKDLNSFENVDAYDSNKLTVMSEKILSLDSIMTLLHFGAGSYLNSQDIKEAVGVVTYTKEEIKSDIISLVNLITLYRDMNVKAIENDDPTENVYDLLSYQAVTLKLIVDSLLDLKIFTKIDDYLVKQLVKDYVTEDSDIAKYISANEILDIFSTENGKIESAKIKLELHYLIDTFAQLGANGTLKEIYVVTCSDVDYVEGQPCQKQKGEYVFAEKDFTNDVAEILIDVVDKSILVEKFLTGALKDMLVGDSLTSQEYDDIVKAEHFSWRVEIILLSNMSMTGNLSSVLNDANSLPIALLEGLSKKSNEQSYYLNESTLIKRVILNGLEKNSSDELVKKLVQCQNLGLEFEKLFSILQVAGIAELDLKNVEDQMKENLSVAVLERLSAETIGSEFLPTVVEKVFGETLRKHVDTTNFIDEDYSRELDSIAHVIYHGGVVESKTSKIDIDTIDKEFSNPVRVTVLKAVNEKIDESLFLQGAISANISKSNDPLVAQNICDDITTEQRWGEELTALIDVIEDGDLATDGRVDMLNIDKQLKVLDVPTLQSLEDNIGVSVILKEVMKKELQPVMGTLYIYDASWTAEKWTLEMKNMKLLAQKMPGEVLDTATMSTNKRYRVEAIERISQIVETSEIVRKTLREPILDILHNNPVYDIDSWSNLTWKEEMTSLYYISREAGIRDDSDGKDYVDMNNVVDKTRVKLTLLGVSKLECRTSVLVQNILNDALNPIVNPQDNGAPKYSKIDMLTWTGETWENEVGALCVVLYTLDDYNGKPGYFDSNKIMPDDKIPVSTLDVVVETSDNQPYGLTDKIIIRRALTEKINNIASNTSFVQNNYGDDNQIWYDEIDSLADLTHTLKYEENDGVHYGYVVSTNISFDIIKLSSLKVCLDDVGRSLLIRKLMKSPLEDSMNSHNKSIYTFANVTTEDTDPYASDDEPWSDSTWQNEVANVYLMSQTLVDDSSNQESQIDLKNLKIEECKDSTMNIMKTHASSSIFIRSVLREPIAEMLDKKVDEFVDRWLEEDKWDSEMLAISNFTATLQRNEKGNINIINVPKDVIKLETLLVISNNEAETTRSIIAKNLVKSIYWQAKGSLEKGQWGYELEALHDMLRAINPDNDTVTLASPINLHEKIPVNSLITLRSVIGYSTYLQEEVSESLFTKNQTIITGAPSMAYYPPLSTDFGAVHWSNEIDALHEVMITISGINGEIDMDNPVDLSSAIKLATLDALKNTIHWSSYLQNEMYNTLYVENSNSLEGTPNIAYSINFNNWNKEVEALRNVVNNTTLINDNNEVVLTNIGNVINTSLIEKTLLANIGDNTHDSIYLQNKVKPLLLKMTVVDNIDQLGRTIILDEFANSTRDNLLKIGYANYSFDYESMTVYELFNYLNPDSDFFSIDGLVANIRNLDLNTLKVLATIFTNNNANNVVILKIMMTPILEEIASTLGITLSSFSYSAPHTAFRWDNIIKDSDLVIIADLFTDLGFTNLSITNSALKQSIQNNVNSVVAEKINIANNNSIYIYTIIQSI